MASGLPLKKIRESIEDNERVGRPTTTRNVENVALRSESFRIGRLQTLAQISEATYFLKTPFEEMHSSQTCSVLTEVYRHPRGLI
ncbi:hypothetical protein TNCV_1267461 [Trichonephila clavipes]|nr:hypothetical protein TNCV_1267461 [Trichonephila clavipes]